VKTVSATDAKNRFGDLLEESAEGPVRIEKNGRPVAYVISVDDYDLAKDLIGLARVKQLIASADEKVLAVLRGFSSGAIPRQAAIRALSLNGYGQLLRALSASGIAPPSAPGIQRKKMADAFLDILHG